MTSKNFHPQVPNLQQLQQIKFAALAIQATHFKALSFVDCTLLQTLSFVWQIKPTIPTTLLYNQSLQLQPSFPSLLPTATPYTTFSTSDLTVTPKDHLLIQLRAGDCLSIYPYPIPKYFLPWQLLLPTCSRSLSPSCFQTNRAILCNHYNPWHTQGKASQRSNEKGPFWISHMF